MRKASYFLLVFFIVLVTLACPNPFESEEEVINSDEFKATLESGIALGGAKFTGQTTITFPMPFATCTGTSQDVTLQMGSPRPDGLIRSELTVLVPFRWDSNCDEIRDGQYSFLAYGLYDPKTLTLTFNECPGSSVQGTSVLNLVLFEGKVECFDGDNLWYQLDFSVRLPDL